MRLSYMKKKIAIVSGAGSGIGKAIALDLSRQNYQVVLIDRDARRLKIIANKLLKGCEKYLLDVSNDREVAACIKAVVRQHKRIDLLINSAGLFYEGTSNITLKELQQMLQTNLFGAIYLARLVAKQMKQQRAGYIINISSLAGKRSFSDLGGYSASKFGLLGFNDALFKEMIPYHVKVTAICPSIVNTPMTKDYDMLNRDKIQPRDIVKTVNYLLSLDFNSAIREIEINCADIVLDSE